MIRCACQFPGHLESSEHRRFHRAWERITTGHGPTTTEATRVDVTDIFVMLDQLIAHTHGGPKPDLTPGAQGWIAANRMRDSEKR